MVKKAKRAKVAVFTCGLDIAQTETKGTVLIKNADEMLNFTTGEEKQLEKVRRRSNLTPTTALVNLVSPLDFPRNRRLRGKGHHCGFNRR